MTSADFEPEISNFRRLSVAYPQKAVTSVQRFCTEDNTPKTEY